jgi:hypothetical protein
MIDDCCVVTPIKYIVGRSAGLGSWIIVRVLLDVMR